MSRAAFSAAVALVAAIATTVVLFSAERFARRAADPDMDGLETAIWFGLAGLAATWSSGRSARASSERPPRWVATVALALAIAAMLVAFGRMLDCGRSIRS